MRLSVAGERLELLPERALYWPRRGALLVADVHVGKAETFQRAGIAVPSTQTAADLERLSRLIATVPTESVWVLGDLIHGREAAALALPREITGRHPGVQFNLVRGNHDVHVAGLARSWGFVEHIDGVDLGPFRLRHEPAASEGRYVLAGHLHPVASIGGAADNLRLPCFHFAAEVGVLPAFTEFSGGVAVDLSAGRTFVIADGAVVAFAAGRQRSGRRRPESS